jgi:type IV secretory pathway VirJ component
MKQFRPLILMIAALLASTWSAQAGPCTSQIAATEHQINQAAAVSPPGGAGTPSADQAIGAQLHHQPTPGAVANAEQKANEQAEAALEQARQADARGDADACIKALREARHLFGLD